MRKPIKTGFHIVGTAHAAGCIGPVECEAGITTCTCSAGGASCAQSGTSCNPPLYNGTCSCNFTCSGAGGGAMDYYYCSQLSNPISCRNQEGADAFCNSKGLCSVADGCHWDNGSCGDGSCNNGETCSTCPVDCNTCASCGDGSLT